MIRSLVLGALVFLMFDSMYSLVLDILLKILFLMFDSMYSLVLDTFRIRS